MNALLTITTANNRRETNTRHIQIEGSPDAIGSEVARELSFPFASIVQIELRPITAQVTYGEPSEVEV